MDDSTKASYEAESKELRSELKLWEVDWQKAHDGKKPSRDAIKANPDIAVKYKQYAKIQSMLDGKIPPPPPPPKETSASKKRKPEPVPAAETPSKRSKFVETPSKDRLRDEELMNTPGISRKLFSPTVSVTSLGPTPQRDGRVLGLFDLLVEKELGTPSKDMGRAQRRNSITATPSKRMTKSDEETTPRLGRTPMSTSKRHMLNSFMTPLKNRDSNVTAFTPTSVSKLQFDTPAFLKRHSLPALDENGEFDAPAPLRLPRKPLGRGLSEIVASLRKVEDDVLDDELDALREAEDEEMGISRPKPTTQSQPKDVDLGQDVEISKLPLGGFDDEGMFDGPVDETEGMDHRGNPLRVFKKKGQKRTTRKVNMKPTRTKRPVDLNEGVFSGDEYEDTIPETQAGAQDLDSDADFEETRVKKAATKPAKKEGTVKKAARKVNELAHANFQKLKLKNNGAKGGPGYNSKFRRRR